MKTPFGCDNRRAFVLVAQIETVFFNTCSPMQHHNHFGCEAGQQQQHGANWMDIVCKLMRWIKVDEVDKNKSPSVCYRRAFAVTILAVT